MSKVILTAQVPNDLVQALRARAQHTDRSLSAEVRCALRAHLSTPETSNDAPQGAVAKVSDAPARHAA